MHHLALEEFLRSALLEDIGGGDVTTDACIASEKQSRAYFIAKESGVVCGLQVAEQVFLLVDPTLVFTPLVKEGALVGNGMQIAEIQGSAAGILKGERLALNLLQRMSAIATKTAKAVDEVANTGAKICDTRKTTPLMRQLEKYAVRCGGGQNHRFGLYDGVLIKDNHIVAAGGITAAIDKARAHVPHTLKIEVEVQNLTQVEEALNARAGIIMLDNMDLCEMKQAVEKIAGRALVEASGNMDRRSLKEVADTGVDFISIGALTHSVLALDISLKFEI